MNIRYHILFRACDKIDSVHNAKRPFGLNKLEVIKVSFYSLYTSLKDNQFKFIIIGDDLSQELIDFFNRFEKVVVENSIMGSASKSLQKQTFAFPSSEIEGFALNFKPIVSSSLYVLSKLLTVTAKWEQPILIILSSKLISFFSGWDL